MVYCIDDSTTMKQQTDNPPLLAKLADIGGHGQRAAAAISDAMQAILDIEDGLRPERVNDPGILVPDDRRGLAPALSALEQAAVDRPLLILASSADAVRDAIGEFLDDLHTVARKAAAADNMTSARTPARGAHHRQRQAAAGI